MPTETRSSGVHTWTLRTVHLVYKIRLFKVFMNSITTCLLKLVDFCFFFFICSERIMKSCIFSLFFLETPKQIFSQYLISYEICKQKKKYSQKSLKSITAISVGLKSRAFYCRTDVSQPFLDSSPIKYVYA